MVTGVMGWPVRHSVSPLLHNHWLGENNINGIYIPLPVMPAKLNQALKSLAALGVRGVNLTIPHKEAAMDLLDGVDQAAERIGAVNTIVVKENERLEGRNTASAGFLENLRTSGSEWQPSKGPALILGAGGAARAIAFALLDAGVPEIRLVNRTIARAERLAESIGTGCKVAKFNEINTAVADVALLVNATSIGMEGQEDMKVSLDNLPTNAIVNDIVYKPLHTPLLVQAQKRGNKVVDGLGMLLHQARYSFDAWFGVKPEITTELRRLAQHNP